MRQATQIFRRLQQYFTRPQPSRAPEPEPVKVQPPEPAVPPQRMTAVEVLRNEPNLSPAELAERTGVTLSYANSLVRRRNPRPVAVSRVQTISAAVGLAEDCTRPQLVEAAAAGVGVMEIAEKFKLAPGEVDFALKMARLEKKV